MALKIDLTSHYIDLIRNRFGDNVTQCPFCPYRNDNSQTLCHISVAHNELESVLPAETKKFLRGIDLFGDDDSQEQQPQTYLIQDDSQSSVTSAAFPTEPPVFRRPQIFMQNRRFNKPLIKCPMCENSYKYVLKYYI